MSFETKLEKYARLIVQSGLNVQEKQTVVISASIESYQLVRAVTKQAYLVGAKEVVGEYPPPAALCAVPVPPTGPVDNFPAEVFDGTGTLNAVFGVVVTLGVAFGATDGFTLGGAGFGETFFLAGLGDV